MASLALLHGHSLLEETAAIKRHLEALAKQPLRLSNDFAPPLSQRPRRLQLPPIPLADPPSPLAPESDSQAIGSIQITLKSLKPPLSFSLTCPSSSTIAELKNLLLLSDPLAPPPDSQRWLHKGKALADNKLLKEYQNIKSGDTIHLMLKPIPVTNVPATATAMNQLSSNPASSIVTPSSTIAEPGSPSLSPSSQVVPPKSPIDHHRAPTPQLAMSIPKITMDIDGTQLAEAPFISRSRSGSVNTNPALSPHLGISESFRSVVTRQEFWVELKKFLLLQFGPYGPGEENARQMWEHWFNSSKEWMSASEIAKIREAAGISGMGGR